MPGLTIAYQEPTGYKYVETSDDLKVAASGLPCFLALQWPGYSSDIVERHHQRQAGRYSVMERLVSTVSEFS